MSKVRIFLLRRWYVTAGAALLATAAIFYAVNYPASVSAAATTRQLPIYSVERSQKVCSISFDAAWGDAKVRQCQDNAAPDYIRLRPRCSCVGMSMNSGAPESINRENSTAMQGAAEHEPIVPLYPDAAGGVSRAILSVRCAPKNLQAGLDK